MYEESWSTGKVEHIYEGTKIAKELLERIPPFCENKLMVQLVCYLILHHDDTNYSYPICEKGRNQGVISNPRKFENLFDLSLIKMIDESSLKIMVEIIREADALQGTDYVGIKRTWEYSLERSLPLFSEGSPLSAFMWEESVIGNIKLAIRRSLIDAKTEKGRQQAFKGFSSSIKLISDLCSENSIPYENEPGFDIDKLASIGFAHNTNDCNLIKYESWDILSSILRQAPLHGDPEFFPYESATIESRLVELDKISPLAKYVLSSQVELQKNIYNSLIENFALDIYSLAGIIEFTFRGKSIRLAPPIIEIYTETVGEYAGEVIALVDGLHRCTAARALGLSHIRAVVISNIDPAFPLVPLPLKWKDVESVAEVPPISEKRKFRFKSAIDLNSHFNMFPKYYYKSYEMDDNKAKYFFYRNLSYIGSDGIRMAVSHKV